MNSSFEISAIRKTMLAVSISAVLSGVVSAQEATVEKDDSSTADTKAVELIMVKGTRRTQELQDAAGGFLGCVLSHIQRELQRL